MRMRIISHILIAVSYPGPRVEGPVVLGLEVEVDHHDCGGQDVGAGQQHLGQAQPDQPVSAQDGGGGGAPHWPAVKAAARKGFSFNKSDLRRLTFSQLVVI